MRPLAGMRLGEKRVFADGAVPAIMAAIVLPAYVPKERPSPEKPVANIVDGALKGAVDRGHFVDAVLGEHGAVAPIPQAAQVSRGRPGRPPTKRFSFEYDDRNTSLF